MFVVKPYLEKKNPQKKIAIVEKEMKVVLFLCRSENDRHSLHNAGFCVVGTHLCWSYPDEKIVHVLDMDPLNKITRRITPNKSAIFRSGRS